MQRLQAESKENTGYLSHEAPKASRMLQRSLLTSGHGSLLAEGTTPSTVTRTLLLTVRREGTACVHSWDTTVLSSACWSGRGWATCELSCHRHREQVLETPAKQQGKEYEAPNFRCKCKSQRGSDLNYGRVVLTVTDGLVKALQHHKVPCWAQWFTRTWQILESSIM